MTASDDDVIGLLEDLVRLDSVNPGLDPSGRGEAEMAGYVVEWARRLGLRTQVIEPVAGRPSVVVRSGRDRGGRRLLLCGHLDTVGLSGCRDGVTPRIEGDRMYGRGTYDMKAGLAAALEACRRSADVDGEVLVAAVADEELASTGVRQLIESVDISRVDAAVVTEPTERQVGTAHRGFIWTEVEVTGVAAHGSRPELGADAIVAAAHLVGGFDELDRRLRGRQHPFLGSGNLHASLIRGGTEESTIPDRCVFTVERRTLPGETLALLERDVAGVVERFRSPDPRIAVETRTLLHRAPLETPIDAEIVTRLRAAAGPRAPVVPLSYWADSAFLSEAGIPTVLYGPDGDGAHADVEWVSVTGTIEVADVLTRLAHDFCGRS